MKKQIRTPSTFSLLTDQIAQQIELALAAPNLTKITDQLDNSKELKQTKNQLNRKLIIAIEEQATLNEIKSILDSGAEPHARGKYKQNALGIAFSSRRLDTAKELIKRGARPTIVEDSDQGYRTVSTLLAINYPDKTPEDCEFIFNALDLLKTHNLLEYQGHAKLMNSHHRFGSSFWSYLYLYEDYSRFSIPHQNHIAQSVGHLFSVGKNEEAQKMLTKFTLFEPLAASTLPAENSNYQDINNIVQDCLYRKSPSYLAWCIKNHVFDHLLDDSKHCVPEAPLGSTNSVPFVLYLATIAPTCARFLLCTDYFSNSLVNATSTHMDYISKSRANTIDFFDICLSGGLSPTLPDSAGNNILHMLLNNAGRTPQLALHIIRNYPNSVDAKNIDGKTPIELYKDSIDNLSGWNQDKQTKAARNFLVQVEKTIINSTIKSAPVTPKVDSTFKTKNKTVKIRI